MKTFSARQFYLMRLKSGDHNVTVEAGESADALEQANKELLGTSKNRPYSSNATKLPANDSASFPFRFINVHSEAVSDRQRDQFFEVPSWL
jgi:hypothetical protein